MQNGIRTIYPSRVKNKFNSKFCVVYRVWKDTSEEGRRIYRPKRWQFNNEDEDNSPNIVREKK